MSNLEVVIISLVAVFAGLAILSFIISLFPLWFRPAVAKAPAAPQPGQTPTPREPEEDEDELSAVLAAAVQAFEEETNPLVRNADEM